MDTTARYSFIACPACGKTFKFWDDFKNTPSGRVLKCPKCRGMFAFRVMDENEEDVMERAYTADVQDLEAKDKFLEEMKRKLSPSENSEESTKGSKSGSKSEDTKDDSSVEQELAEVEQVSPLVERKVRNDR